MTTTQRLHKAQRDSLELCYQIERAGASPQLTKLGTQVTELRSQLGEVQVMVARHGLLIKHLASLQTRLTKLGGAK